MIDHSRDRNGAPVKGGDVARVLQHGARMAINELNIWRDVNDPHVLRLLDWVKQGKYKITFVMPLATRSLADHPVRQLSLNPVLSILVQIMDGLIHIHDKGYIHRDLKPPNVLLTEHGDELKVVVADFGISARGPTHTGKSGTRSWMSPEVQMGRRHDKKVDAYALGLILWWMLFGSTYFKDCDMVPKVIDWNVVAKEDVLVLDFLHRLLEESPEQRWTVKAARRHPLVAHISSSTATDTDAISQGSVVASAAPSNGNASNDIIPPSQSLSIASGLDERHPDRTN
ncbi:hypothetical protein FRB95_011354 [Tulasnella sp. JGI-2019a]|nr:hypothetical protein FRB95_011354 [Tulasnella sp. JGI-2019a]